MSENVCISCQKPFICDIAAGKETCWCMEKPMNLSVPENVSGTNSGCFCPECLDRQLKINE